MKIKCILFLFLFLLVNSLQNHEIELYEGKPVNIKIEDLNKGDIYFFIKAFKDQYVNLKFIGRHGQIFIDGDYDELSNRSLDSKIILDHKNRVYQNFSMDFTHFFISYLYQVSSSETNYVCFTLKNRPMSISNITVEYYIQENTEPNNDIYSRIVETEEITFKANKTYSYYIKAIKPQKVHVNMKMKYKKNNNPFSYQFFDYSNITYSDHSSKCTNEVKDNILSATCTFTVCSESYDVSSFIFTPNIDLEVNYFEMFRAIDSEDSGSSDKGKNTTNANQSSFSGVIIFIIILILIIIGVVAFFVIKKYRTSKNNEIETPLAPVEI